MFRTSRCRSQLWWCDRRGRPAMRGVVEAGSHQRRRRRGFGWFRLISIDPNKWLAVSVAREAAWDGVGGTVTTVPSQKGDSPFAAAFGSCRPSVLLRRMDGAAAVAAASSTDPRWQPVEDLITSPSWHWFVQPDAPRLSGQPGRPGLLRARSGTIGGSGRPSASGLPAARGDA